MERALVRAHEDHGSRLQPHNLYKGVKEVWHILSGHSPLNNALVAHFSPGFNHWSGNWDLFHHRHWTMQSAAAANNLGLLGVSLWWLLTGKTSLPADEIDLASFMVGQLSNHRKGEAAIVGCVISSLSLSTVWIWLVTFGVDIIWYKQLTTQDSSPLSELRCFADWLWSGQFDGLSPALLNLVLHGLIYPHLANVM